MNGDSRGHGDDDEPEDKAQRRSMPRNRTVVVARALLVDRARWLDAVPDVVEAALGMVWSFVVFSSTIDLLWFDAGSLGCYLCLEVLIVSGLVMSYPTPEREVSRWLHRLRHPTTTEAERLKAAWNAVARKAGRARLVCHPETRTVRVGRFRVRLLPCEPDYRLWVTDAGPVPTMPATTVGYPIVVTRWAVHSLSPAQLEAVVAHQLGYLLVPDWRRALESMTLWYSLPARGFALLGRWVWPVLRRVPALGCLVFGVLGGGVFMVILSAAYFGDLDTAAKWVALVTSPVWGPPLFAVFDRHRERRADCHAADLGYGRVLLDTLYAWQNREIEHSGPGQRPTATHRIAALERYLPPSRT